MRIEWKFTIFLTITILLNIQFYPKDQQKYFMIFNKFQLYIEKPHRHDESGGSVGLKKAQPKLISNLMNMHFIECWNIHSP